MPDISGHSIEVCGKHCHQLIYSTTLDPVSSTDGVLHLSVVAVNFTEGMSQARRQTVDIYVH
eukprot:236452-Pelagomonas_calceolata.AAC.1